MDSTARREGRLRRTGLGVLLVASLLVVYSPALRAGFVWDDQDHVVGNPLVRSPEGLSRIWADPPASPQYYPLTFTVFWLQDRLWGDRPFGYHLVNVLLHGGNALLLGAILRALGVPGAGLAAGLFALHPVHVESVAWVAELKNVLSTLFCLGALAAYLHHAGLWDPARAPEPAAGPGRGRPGRWYAAALCLFALGLLSKTVTAMLAPVLLVVLWWKRGRVSGVDALEAAPFFALGAAAGLFTSWFERAHVLAEGSDWALTGLERVLVAGRVAWFYVGKLVWPFPLSFIYPRWEVDAFSPSAYAYPLSVLAVLVLLWSLRRRVGRGPAAAGLCFAATVFPALGFFNVYFMRYSYVADHFAYLSSAGILACAGCGLTRMAELAGPFRGREAGRAGQVFAVAARGVPAAVLVVLGALSWGRCRAFADNETLWRDTVRKNPAAWVAHNNLGVILDARGDRAEAERHYREAIALRPTYWEALNNLGLLLAETGRPREAEEVYRKAAAGNASYAAPLFNLARLREEEGRWAEAEQSYRSAIRADPTLKEAYYALGLLLGGTGRPEEAEACYRDVLVLDPGHAGARYHLGVALDRQGRGREAADEYRRAIEAAPDHVEALNNLASHLGAAGGMEEAAVLFARAVALRPDEAAPRVNLARALAALGRRQEAAAELREAQRLAPDDEGIREELRALGTNP